MKTSKTQTNFRNRTFIVCIFLVNLFVSGSIKAAIINVSSVVALQTAINNSNAGDVIILADGTYLNNTVNIVKSNITVKSASPGGVFLNGTNDINLNGNYIIFSGFQFTSGDIGGSSVIQVYGSHNLLTQLNFSGYYSKKYIEVKAGTQYNEITYCNMEKKPAAAASGCTIQISTSPTVIGYHKIRNCSFKDYYGTGGDFGNEPIRIGLSTENSNKSRAIVEYCYFNNTGLGDSESISIKCQENTIRFCTFTNQQNAMLVFRNGDNNLAYSNFFINAGGIRVKEANNVFCYNNYFENSGVGTSADAVTYVYDTTNYPVVLNNINFIHNTFYNCGDIDLGGTGATNNTWANNIFQKSSGALFTNPNLGTTWAGNIYQGTLGISIPSGMTNVNPLLVINGDGYKGLSASSPAINAASSSYPAILDIAIIDDDPTLLFDAGGKLRPTIITLKDVGSDEFTTGSTTNHPLAVTEVGPSYLGGPLSVNSFGVLDTKSAIKVFPNPMTTSFGIETLAKEGSLVEFAIFNLNGQLVKEAGYFQKQSTASQNNEYDVSELNNGIYLLKVVSENASRTMKLIIQK
ncbi:MAG: T9SS type A sorting domain-containing protein [Flavobacterium sp.]|nr:T9SS type A sorting domain-containing protein [Flavobacterium sp.]